MHQFRLPTNISILIQDRIPSTPSTLSVVIVIILPVLLVGSGEASKPMLELLQIHSYSSGGADLRKGNQNHNRCSLLRGRQSHMHPWVLPCNHLGRKEISASHRSTFCWSAQRWTGVTKQEFWLWIIFS